MVAEVPVLLEELAADPELTLLGGDEVRVFPDPEEVVVVVVVGGEFAEVPEL